MNQDFTVKFSPKARVLEYDDPAGKIEFTFDFLSPNNIKCLVIDHYPPGMLRPPNYDDAYKRSKQYLESCGYQVEVLGD
jgi:hypothetical protein